MGLGDRTLQQVDVADEGVVDVPFGFTINGTSSPATTSIVGDLISAVARAAAGRFTVTMATGYFPYSVIFAHAGASVVANSTDVNCQCDWSTVPTDGILKVKTQAGATEIDPTDGTLIGGFIRCKITDRKAVR